MRGPRTSTAHTLPDPRWRAARLAVPALLALAFAAAPARAQDVMPVFEVTTPKVDSGQIAAILKAVAPGVDVTRDPNPVSGENSVALLAGEVFADGDLRSGGIFLADRARLWRAPASKPKVPDVVGAKSIADRFLRDFKLLPGASGPVSFGFAGAVQTVGGSDVGQKLNRTLLSREVRYTARVRLPDPNGTLLTYPVIGGGGDVQVTVGDGGRIVGYSGAWRPVTRTIDKVPVISADEAIKRAVGDGSVRDPKATMAYYAPPAFQAQQFLVPVWLVNGFVVADNEVTPIRTQIVAATEKFGPVFPVGTKPEPHPVRPAPPSPGDEKPPRATRAMAPFATNPFECGTSWIGTSQGLSGSSGNRQGFLDRCRSDGWLVNFDWGDANAWESDFEANDDSYVDAADLVFYTGHADQNGWVLNTPASNFFDYPKVAGAIDRFGENDLEWLIIAACGPLQSSHFVGNTSNAFDRWRPIFDGLHVFMGYGAVTYDNTDEGRRFMELAQSGWSVTDAWFRTAQEVQPATNGYAAPNGPNIVVVAMYAHTGDHCAGNDHLWGHGSTCADVPSGAAQQRYMIWSGT